MAPFASKWFEASTAGSRKAERLALGLLFPSIKGKGPEVRNLKHVAFFPRIGVAFNRLQKNGNSTAVGFLHYLEHGGYEPAGQAKAQAVRFSELGTSGVIRLNKARRVVVVRDPYSRTLSAFLDKFRLQDYRRDYGQFELNKRGFRNFLTFLEKGGLHANKHWSPQTDRMLLAHNKYNAVIPFSSFPDAFVRSLEGWVPQTRDKWAEFARGGPEGPPATKANTKIEAFYSLDDFETIERLFEADFAVPQIRDEATRVREAFERSRVRE